MTVIYMLFTLSSCSFITLNTGKKENVEESDSSDDPVQSSESVYPEGIYPAQDNYDLWKAEAKARVDALNYRAFENSSFTIAVTPGISVAPSESVSYYDSALSERNAMVEEKYSITIGQIETPVDLMLSDSYSAYLSGLYYSDLMMIPASSLGAFAEKGYLLNVFSLPYIDYDKEYFDMNAMAQACAGYNSYAVIGDMTQDVGVYYCIYANTALFESLGLELPYQAVEDGSWTWDMLLDFTREAADVDGGVKNIGAGSVSDLVSVVYKSSGQNYMSTWLGATPKISYGTDATVKVTDIIRSLREGDKIIFDQYSASGSALADFRNGNVMFFTGTVSQMSEVCKMGGEWTVLPVPKTDASQETYRTFVSPSAPVIVTSASSPYPEDIAYALTALNAASGKYLTDAYYDDLIISSINNSKTLDMLDYVTGIKSGEGLYDFVYMFREQYPALSEDTYGALWSYIISGTGTVAETAAAAHYDLNWRMVNAFPVLG